MLVTDTVTDPRTVSGLVREHEIIIERQLISETNDPDRGEPSRAEPSLSLCCVNTFDTCPGCPGPVAVARATCARSPASASAAAAAVTIDPLQADTARHSKNSQPPFARMPAPASPQVEPTLPSTDREILWGGTSSCITCQQRTQLSCFAYTYTIMPEGPPSNIMCDDGQPNGVRPGRKSAKWDGNWAVNEGSVGKGSGA